MICTNPSDSNIFESCWINCLRLEKTVLKGKIIKESIRMDGVGWNSKSSIICEKKPSENCLQSIWLLPHLAPSFKLRIILIIVDNN